MDGATRPLVVADEGEDVEDVLRLAAAAGTVPEVSVGPGAAWRTAPMVVLTRSAAERCAADRLPRRSGVVLLLEAAPAESCWALATRLGADHVVALPAGGTWLTERFADCAVDSAAGTVLAVVGARGGAGASVLAVALALAAAERGPALLVDGDRFGGGLDLLLGQEKANGLRWPDLSGTSGRVAPQELLSALPHEDGLAVLAWDRAEPASVPAPAMAAVLRSARRGGACAVVDLPRHLDDCAVEAATQADRTLLVVPAEVRAVAAAARLVTVLRPRSADLRVVVRGPAPAGLRGRDVAGVLELPLAAVCRAEPGLALQLERGDPPGSRRGPLQRLARQLLDDLSDVPARAA